MVHFSKSGNNADIKLLTNLWILLKFHHCPLMSFVAKEHFSTARCLLQSRTVLRLSAFHDFAILKIIGQLFCRVPLTVGFVCCFLMIRFRFYASGHVA